MLQLSDPPADPDLEEVERLLLEAEAMADRAEADYGPAYREVYDEELAEIRERVERLRR